MQTNRLYTLLVIRSSDGYAILSDERVKRVWGIPKFTTPHFILLQGNRYLKKIKNQIFNNNENIES